MTPTLILSVGEAMLELSQADRPDTWHLGIAGDTLNTAWYLRRLLGPDWRVGYVSRVGKGPFSDRMLAFLKSEGIEADHVSRDPAREIGLYAISLSEGERSFSYWRDTSAARLLAEDTGRLQAALDGAGIVYLSGITLAVVGDRGRATLQDVLMAARAAGTRLVFDPNLRLRLWPDVDTMRAAVEATAAMADVVLPSFDDEATHFGDADPEASVARYLALGAGQVVVKNGGGPISFGGTGGEGRIDDLRPERAVDTTAAGDSFNAAYLAAWLDGADCGAAIRAGHALSRQVIRQHGALSRAAVAAVRSGAD